MKIISGGQTGVDRAALDAAIVVGIPQGGWCPKGRRAELNTVIPDKYILQETASSDYSERTKFNIRDSDGTLILVPELPLPANITDGTLLTIAEVKAVKKPYRIIDLTCEADIAEIIVWIKEHSIKTLNVAGPRESQAPGIYNRSFYLIKKLCSSFLEENTHRF